MTVFDAVHLRQALERSADPLTGRAALTRLVEAHPRLPDELETDPLLAEALVAVSIASHSLFGVLERDDDAIPMLSAAVLRVPLAVDDCIAEASALLAQDEPQAALRRWKHRQIVRIAGRDLLGLADLRTVGTELAAVAQASLGVALAIAAPTVSMAVIGVGKLGGAELNYASDVDVLFVHDGDSAEAERSARAVLRAMTEPTADGIVFRTDADLRPEGRSGPLSRTLDAYAAYWEG